MSSWDFVSNAEQPVDDGSEEEEEEEEVPQNAGGITVGEDIPFGSSSRFDKMKNIFVRTKAAVRKVGNFVKVGKELSEARVIDPSGIEVAGVSPKGVVQNIVDTIKENPIKTVGIAAGAATIAGGGYGAYKVYQYYKGKEDVAKFEESKPENIEVMQATPLGENGAVYSDRIKSYFVNLHIKDLVIPGAFLLALVLMRKKH